MRTPGLVAIALVLLASPLTVACYPPRIQSCRDPMTDFSSFSSITIPDAVVPVGGAEEAVGAVRYTIRAQTSIVGTSTRCVQVHSALSSGGAVIETIDTPIRATVTGGVLTTTPMFHYRFARTAATLHVETLGVTLEVPVASPGASRDVGLGSFFEAGVVPVDAGAAADAGR